MSSQVDGHDEERELRSFGYEQQLSRSMGVFSSLSISISCMCITAGIFNGAYAEYLLLPARLVAANVVAVPDGMPLELAVIVQTVACCVHGAEIAGAGPDTSVAVLGLGPIGLGLVAACSARGARVLGVGRRRAERLRLARAFGAEATVTDPGALADLTGGEGPDVVVVEAVGQPQAWSQAEATVRPGGAYPFAELLTHTYPLERVAEPLAQAAGLADPDDRLLKAVIRP
jgi:threonine dehydrogenase-like Zn-dependent dehydrogenase